MCLPGRTARLFLAGSQGTLSASRLLLLTTSWSSSTLIAGITFMVQTIQLTVHHADCCLLSCFSIGCSGTIHRHSVSLMLIGQWSTLFCLKSLNLYKFSSFTCLKSVSAWIFCFIGNCKLCQRGVLQTEDSCLLKNSIFLNGTGSGLLRVLSF